MRCLSFSIILFLPLTVNGQMGTLICPPRTHRVSTNNPLEPFICANDGTKDSKLNPVDGPTGFQTSTPCPRGTRKVEAANGLRTFRCVRLTAGEAEPELTPILSRVDIKPQKNDEAQDPLTRGCRPGERKVRTTDPDHPFQCMKEKTTKRRIDLNSYLKFSIPNQLSFEYPQAFLIEDAWKEEVPTLYLKLDEDSSGKPVTITISRYDKNQANFEDMDSAILRGVEWQGARDRGMIVVAGFKSRYTEVADDTRSVYLPLHEESYYCLMYSAPAHTYKTYLPAFERLLKSLKLVKARS